MFRRFAPAVAVVALTSALTLPPAAEAKPRLTQSRAESAMWRYAARAYSRRLAGRYVYADCSRVTRTFFDCTYAAMVTEAESFDCGYKQGLGEPVPSWCPGRANPESIRYQGTGSVRLINGRLLVRASYPR